LPRNRAPAAGKEQDHNLGVGAAQLVVLSAVIEQAEIDDLLPFWLSLGPISFRRIARRESNAGQKT
jgi:hypothetical protein